jgi:GNAT superfamily N-acetyltransferase
MSHDEVRDGDLAAVVTYLEMRESPTVEVPPSPLSLRRIEHPTPDEYRALFRQVGDVELFTVVDGDDLDAGILELDFRTSGECELSFVGLVPVLAGKGHGRWLLAEAVRLAWREGVKRVHVHTCTLDHPAALAAYRRAGFVPLRREIERFPDPRLIGVLPRDCAPQIPLIG